MSNPKTQPSSNREALTVITVAVLLTVVLLLVAFRTSNETAKPPPVDFSEKETSALLRLKKTDAVFYELLNRDDVSLSVLRDCLLHLAKSKRTTDLNVLLQWIHAWPDNTPRSVQQHAGDVLSDMTARQRQVAQERMATWSADELSTPTRQIVAAVKLADGSNRIELLSAVNELDQLQEHLHLLPLIPSIAVQESYYGDVRRLLETSTAEQPALNDETQRLLIDTMGRMRGREADRAHDLIGLIVSKQHSEVAIESLNRIREESWPEKELGYLAAATISFIVDTDESAQRATAFRLAEKIVSRLPEVKRQRFSDRLAELQGNGADSE